MNNRTNKAIINRNEDHNRQLISDSNSKVIRMIGEFMSNNKWGEITIQFKEGKPILIRQTEQIRLDD